MAFNGSGTFSINSTGQPVVSGTTISDTVFNALTADLATGLTNCITRDGQSPATSNIPMGSNKITGLGSGTAATDAAALSQVQSGAVQFFTAGGTSDVITGTLSPAISAYAAGQTFRFVATGANTTSVTLNLNGLGAKAVTKNGATALVAGDIPASSIVSATYDGAQFQLGQVNKVGTSAYNIVALDSSARLPAVDGLQLTNISSGSKIQPISASVGSNALTISASALTLDFRSTTLGSGTVTTVSGTPANLVVSSGSTLGTVNATAARLVVLAMNNAGTIELAVVNISGGNQLDETNLITTTAEGGAGAADSANVIYSTTARTSLAYRVIGFIDINEATAGTWATAPSAIQGVGGQALSALSSVGYGQTWQNVAGSRAIATTYYNTTGKPIQVAASLSSNAAAFSSTVTIDGITFNGSSASSAGTGVLVSIIVPPGKSYSLTCNAGTPSINTWAELK